MNNNFTISPDQYNKIIESFIHKEGWDWHTAIPTFIGACLAFLFAMFLDYLRNRSAKKRALQERRENELSAIVSTIVKLNFNIEAITHVLAQQILPHYRASKASFEIGFVRAKSPRLALDEMQKFQRIVYSRCTQPHFLSLEAFDKISFLIQSNAQLVQDFGWIESFSRDLSYIINARNQEIERVTDNNKYDDLSIALFDVENQITISTREIGNAYQLVDHLIIARKSLTKIAKEEYEKVTGPKFVSDLPAPLETIMIDMRTILKDHGIEIGP